MESMSDPVAISLIGMIGSIIAAGFSVFNNWLSIKNRSDLKEGKESIKRLEQNTNGMTEKLVKVTGESEYAKGHLAGVETATTLIKVDPTFIK